LTTQIDQPRLYFVPDDDASRIARDLRLGVGRVARRLRQLYAQGGDGQLAFIALAVLSRLQREGPASASQLASGERVTAQAVGVAVADLERRRLVGRAPDPGDRRRSVVSLTDAGRAALSGREQRVLDRMVAAVEDGFTPAERRRLAAAAPLLERLAELI
jgi:DNA-binding MarR family transcriptional regulator